MQLLSSLLTFFFFAVFSDFNPALVTYSFSFLTAVGRGPAGRGYFPQLLCLFVSAGACYLIKQNKTFRTHLGVPRLVLFWYVVHSLGGLYLSVQALPSVFESLTFTETFLGSLGVFLPLKELVIDHSLSSAAENNLADKPSSFALSEERWYFLSLFQDSTVFPDLITAPLFLQLDYSLLVTLKREIDV